MFGSPVSTTVHLIAGPTGVGKSRAASDLALRTGAPVVVADRIQCFTDLATTSARSGAEMSGVRRVWLGDRTVADGDYSAEKAVEVLVETVSELGRTASAVVVEGGSISLLTLLAGRLPRLPWDFTVQLLSRPADNSLHLRALTSRAHVMLRPEPPLRSLLDELAELWRDPAKRPFAASVNGLEAALEWCERHSLDPQEATIGNVPENLLDELACLIAVRHAEHGADQEKAFCALLSDLSVQLPARLAL